MIAAGSDTAARKCSRSRCSSIIAASAGGRAAAGCLLDRLGLGNGRLAGGQRLTDDRGRNVVLAPGQADQHIVWLCFEVAGDGVVDDAEQGAFMFRIEAPIGAQRFEADAPARPPGAVLGGAAQRGHEAKVIEDHRPDVEDECLGLLESVLDHVAQRVELALAGRGILAQQALYDFRLQGDVGDALGRPVVHLAGDLAAHLLLCLEH